MNFFESQNPQAKQFRALVVAVLVLVVLFLAAQSVAVMKSWRYVGSTPTPNVITVSGHGEEFVSPDIATISFSVEKTDKTVAAANESVSKDVTKLRDAVLALGVDAKDMQTNGYNVYPKMESDQVICTAYRCPPTKSVLVGYTVTNSVTVKVRNLDKVGSVITALAQNGVTNVSGPDFSVENEDAAKAKARSEAIEKARVQAETLSKELGVRLVRITSFSENGGGYYPMYAKVSAAPMMDSAAGNEATPIMTGQNKISSDVTITYEIR